MTIDAIKEAMRLVHQLYINSREIEVMFLDELTEIIEVRYKDTNRVNFVTKSSITDKKEELNFTKIDELLVLRYREGKDV